MLQRLLGPLGLAGLLASGCTAGPIGAPDNPPAGIGTLNINVIGGPPPWTPWGSGWVERVGDGSGVATAFTVLSTGTVALKLAVGTYGVRYAPPGGYRANVVASEPTRVIVATGAPAAVAFQIRAVTGLSIIVNGLSTGNPGSGGLITIVRTDTTPNVTVLARDDGLVYETVVEAQPGLYSVSYRPPAHFRLQAGVLNPQVGVLADGRTTYFYFPVEPSGGGKGGS